MLLHAILASTLVFVFAVDSHDVVSIETLLDDHELEDYAGTTQAPPTFGKALASVFGGPAPSLVGGSLSQNSMDVVNGLVEAYMHKVQLQIGEKTCIENSLGTLAGDIMGTGRDTVTAIKALVESRRNKTLDSNSLIASGVDAAMKIASLVNGIDILHCLSDCVIAFERRDFQRFGRDIGTALRKILLSNAVKSNRTALPEGVPEESIIEQVTHGVISGFFVRGSAVQITDDSHSDVNIVINLHQCISGNHAIWQELWMAIWDLFAQLAVNPQQHDLGAQHVAVQPKWQSELMLALMQFPMALEKCDAGADQQRMLIEAIQSLSDVQIKFLFPRDRLKPMKVTDELAKAVNSWTDFQFVRFGKEIGMLLRELVMLAFPQKYTVDSSGILRRDLESLAHVGLIHGTKVHHRAFMMGITGAFTLSAITACIALRRLRSFSHDFGLIVEDDYDDGLE